MFFELICIFDSHFLIKGLDISHESRIFAQGLHFPHLNHVPSAELDYYLMQLCALAQGFHPRGYSIAVDLLNSLVPLLLGILLGIIRLRQVFLFQDVTVLRLTYLGRCGYRTAIVNMKEQLL